jgi:hypothetical protein
VSTRGRRPVLQYSKVDAPKGVHIEACRGCSADLYWVRSLVGEVWQALDAGSVQLGQLILVEDEGRLRTRSAPPSDVDSPRYRLHRCPQSQGVPRREPADPNVQ